MPGAVVPGRTSGLPRGMGQNETKHIQTHPKHRTECCNKESTHCRSGRLDSGRKDEPQMYNRATARSTDSLDSSYYYSPRGGGLDGSGHQKAEAKGYLQESLYGRRQGAQDSAKVEKQEPDVVLTQRRVNNLAAVVCRKYSRTISTKRWTTGC